MASGLGALYSQLSRELSLLHPDPTLPAVLAMSDYSTTHSQATAESAFSESHKRDMSTFLSSLAFWQDVLDHCHSADVKQTLLDHFQILFLQQLLYPSLLQSSDTDAGSSVAVLTYVTAMIESLEYPDLMNMMLQYLLAIGDAFSATSQPSNPQTDPPRSPTALRRRESLLLLTAPKDPDDAVEPALFSLVDLILNNISSNNGQAVFAALKLSSTILARQKRFAFGTLLSVQSTKGRIERTVGALEVEVEKFTELATSIHNHVGLQDAYASLVEDVRTAVEAQLPLQPVSSRGPDGESELLTGRYVLSSSDHFMRALRTLLRTFFTNGVDVNLALSQAIISVALCTEIRLDRWLALDPSDYSFEVNSSESLRSWQSHLEDDEKAAFSRLRQASRSPQWPEEGAPRLFTTLQSLSEEFELVRSSVANLDHLISVRKTMLQATSLDTPLLSNNPSTATSPTQATFLDVPTFLEGKASLGTSRSSRLVRSGNEASKVSSPKSRSLASSPVPDRTNERAASPRPATKSLFLPPPPEMPSTTDVLMQEIMLPSIEAESHEVGGREDRKALLNHILTNVVILQEFVLELVAVLQARAAVLGEREIRFT